MAQKVAKKKKLLFVITKSNWGGAQRYVFDLATSMTEKFEVAVALGGDGTLSVRLKEAGITVISLPFLERDISLIKEIFVFRKLFALFKSTKPDIIHLNSSKIGGIGSLAGRLAKVPTIIFTVHGWAFREEWRSRTQQIIIKFLSWLTLLFSHKVIAVSDYDGRERIFFPFVEGKIQVIKNGIGESEFLSRNEARKILIAKAKENGAEIPETIWSEDTLCIGSVGELHQNKGYLYAIEALRVLVLERKRRLVYLIVGNGEDRKKIEESIIKEGLHDKVFLLGEITNANAILPAFDIFLFPSVKEGLPYAVLEAGAAEMPVAASAVGGIPEIIDDMESGILVRPKNSSEIVRALEFLLENEERRKKFGTKLKQKIRKDFSLKKMVRETLEVYKEI